MPTTVNIEEYRMLIDGRLTPARERRSFESVNPSTGDVFARVSDAAIEDVQAAIAAARRAFDEGRWPGLTLAQRGKFLKTIADLIRENAKELAELETLSTGKTLKQTTFIDVPTCADTFEYFGSIPDLLRSRENPVNAPVKSLTEREPRGVVACIIPWNYPLIMAAWKLAPALAAGNTVILKPSRLGSVSILKLASLIEKAGLPAGVVNVVATTQEAAATALVKSPQVDMVSFTGGTATGQKIMAWAAETTKKVSLELGGKSPNLVFADCDFEAALGGTMSAIFMNQGQMCTAGARLLLEDKIYDRFLEELVKRTKALKIGNAFNHETEFGPLVSLEQRNGVLKFIEKGKSEGAKIATGGRIPPGAEFARGAFLEPTIFTDVRPEMFIAQEEAFGPVLAVFKFSGEEEAVRLANDSKYGLAACVWTKDEEKARRISKKLQCGTVWVNTYGGFYNEASFGGTKQSGFGRELGIEGLLEYTQTKHVCIDRTPGGKPLAAAWF